MLSNFFSPSEYANYSLSLTFYSFFLIFANFGIGWTILRNISVLNNEKSNKTSTIVSQGFKLSAIFGLGFSMLLFFLSPYFEIIYKISNLDVNLKYLSIYLFFSNLVSYFENVFQGLRNFTLYAFSSITLNILKLIIVLFSIILKIGISSILGLFAISSIFQFGILLIYIQFKFKFFSSFLRINKKILKKIIKFSILVFIPALFLFLYTKFNQFILAFYVNPAEFAFFAITLTIIDGLSLPIIILSRTSFPYVSTYITKDNKERKMVALIYNTLLKFGLFITIPMSIYFFFFSNNFIFLIFQNEYLTVSNYLKFYIFYLNIKMVGVVGANFLYAADRPNIVFKLTGITAIVSSIMSFLLIPLLFAYGAIISVIVPHSIYIIYTILLVKKQNSIVLDSQFSTSILKFIISAVIPILIFLGINHFFILNFNNLMVYLLFTGIYFCTFFILVVITKAISLEEIKNLIIK